MIGFPKNEIDILSSINSRKERGFLAEDISVLLKQQAQVFLSKGLPLKKTEGWRYFPTQRLSKINYLFPEDLLKQEDFSDLSSSFLPQSLVVSIHNGNVSTSHLPKGVRVFSWKDFLNGSLSLDSKTKECIARSFKKERNGFCSLNNIMSLNGCILLIDQSVEQTIELRYSQDLNQQERGIHLKSFVFIEKDCSARILESFYGNASGESSFFFNLQTDCFLKSHSHLEYYRLDKGGSKDTQVNQLFAYLEEKSKAKFLTLNCFSSASRYLTDVVQERETSSEVRGLSLLGESSHSDHKVLVTHQDEDSSSYQFYQSMLFDSAKHIFNGIINIDEKAQRTSAYQLNKNLIFSENAYSVSCPELDVRADDVEATHGATTTSLDEKNDHFLYLQSRGISKEEAHQLILSSAIKEVLSEIDEKNRIYFENFVWDCLKNLQKFKQEEL